MEWEARQSRIDEFLDLYKQLVDVLEIKYRNARRHYSSVVFEFIKDDESAPVRDKLEICREIRNLLTHSANLEGEPVVEPSAPGGGGHGGGAGLCPPPAPGHGVRHQGRPGDAGPHATNGCCG